MSIAETTRRYTPEDLLTMPDGDRYELVNGQLVERDMGWESSRIGGRVHGLLFAYCEAHPLGVVAPADASYQCFPDSPTKVRKPDTSFIRLDRLPPLHRREGHCPVAPDLAVEVISPNDFYADVEIKVDEYIAAGSQLVWVVNPFTNSVRVHRADHTVSDFEADDEITGETVIPGFRCRVREFFALPEVVQAPEQP